jgi:hypothetical protein
LESSAGFSHRDWLYGRFGLPIRVNSQVEPRSGQGQSNGSVSLANISDITARVLRGKAASASMRRAAALEPVSRPSRLVAIVKGLPFDHYDLPVAATAHRPSWKAEQ